MADKLTRTGGTPDVEEEFGDEWIADEIFLAVYNPANGIDLREESWAVKSAAIRDHLKSEEIIPE